MSSPELVPVPTVEELHRNGLAPRVQEPRYTVYQLSQEGQAAVYAAMAHNAPILAAAEEERRAANRRAREALAGEHSHPACWCGHVHAVHTDRCALCMCAGYAPQDL